MCHWLLVRSAPLYEFWPLLFPPPYKVLELPLGGGKVQVHSVYVGLRKESPTCPVRPNDPEKVGRLISVTSPGELLHFWALKRNMDGFLKALRRDCHMTSISVSPVEWLRSGHADLTMTGSLRCRHKGGGHLRLTPPLRGPAIDWTYWVNLI